MFGSTSPAVAATLWVLIAFSVVTWTIIARKALLQWRLKRLNRVFADAFWKASDLKHAEGPASGMDGPLARVAQAGFHALSDLRRGTEHTLQFSGDARDILEAALRQQIQKEHQTLESGLMVLASVGSTAPFVGLFGTVWGIMNALTDISRAGTASLDVVAGPVGEALIATAIGIAAAVPAVLAYNYGLRRVHLYLAEMEDFAANFLRVAATASLGVKRGK
jgi:biopolymer transport protein ExbB